jgi:hypothetical protein
MQREGDILSTFKSARKGIAMITAIAFLLIMVTIMGLMVSLTARASKQGADIYFQEQAQLLAKSATEYALLAISGHDRSGGDCVNQITSGYVCTGGNCLYDINTTIRYIGLGGLAGDCDDYIAAINTPESNGTVLIDVYVTLDPTQAKTTERISYHRRTMQKP